MPRFFTVFFFCAALVITGCTPTNATPTGRPAYGELIYREGKGEAPACINCHALSGDDFSLGPNMIGLKNRLPLEVTAGQTVEDYLHESIVNPNAYLVPGYRNIMYGLYAEHLNEQDLSDLIAYLLAL